jgi:hypothetical protein
MDLIYAASIIRKRGGIPKSFEINPRFGGSLCEFFLSFAKAI